MTLRLARSKLLKIYQRLLALQGHQGWWPGETAFEVMVGAILTQNTAWTNVERALANLQANAALQVDAILATDPEQLATWLRPAGYFNVKARRLRHFCAWYQEFDGLTGLQSQTTAQLRQQLLAVHGIGPETADDILLYALQRPVFVIDAYTRRLFSRLGLIVGDEDYDTLRLAFERALGPDVALYNDYHAQIVLHAKHVCRVKPRCQHCGLTKLCKRRGVQAAG